MSFSEPYFLGEADFDDFFAWSLAWGGFAWGCEAGVYHMHMHPSENVYFFYKNNFIRSSSLEFS